MFDELWSKSAVEGALALPSGLRDQVEALVREVCREPYAVGFPQRADGPARDRSVGTGPVVVHYQVDDLERLVYVVTVESRG